MRPDLLPHPHGVRGISDRHGEGPAVAPLGSILFHRFNSCGTIADLQRTMVRPALLWAGDHSTFLEDLIVRIATIQARPVLGTFSKGASGSVQLSLAPSGGRHCATSCRHHPANGGGCYAARAEVRPDRKQLKSKLERHEETEPRTLYTRANAELLGMIATADALGERVPWFRLAAFGSLPGRASLTDLEAFRTMIRTAADAGIPVHVPLETRAKFAKYDAAMDGLYYKSGPLEGLDVVPRLSLSRRRPGSVAVESSQVGGAPGTSRADAVAESRELANHERRNGGRAVVCPAVLTGPKFAKRSENVRRVHCGECTACADPRVSLVIYPHH